jgi:hypothetical protein
MNWRARRTHACENRDMRPDSDGALLGMFVALA